MKELAKLFGLGLLCWALSGCAFNARLSGEPAALAAPVVVYVRDEAAIAQAREDGINNGLLVGGMGIGTVLAIGGVAWIVERQRRPRYESLPMQLPPQQIHYHQHNNIVVTPGAVAAQVREALKQVSAPPQQ